MQRRRRSCNANQSLLVGGCSINIFSGDIVSASYRAAYKSVAYPTGSLGILIWCLACVLIAPKEITTDFFVSVFCISSPLHNSVFDLGE